MQKWEGTFYLTIKLYVTNNRGEVDSKRQEISSVFLKTLAPRDLDGRNSPKDCTVNEDGGP